MDTNKIKKVVKKQVVQVDKESPEFKADELIKDIYNLQSRITRVFADLNYKQMALVLRAEARMQQDHVDTFYNLQVSDKEDEQRLEYLKDNFEHNNSLIQCLGLDYEI